MLLERVFANLKNRRTTEEQVAASPMLSDYGTAVYGKMQAAQSAYATKHPGSKKPHGSHKRRGRKTHQVHRKHG